MHRGSQTFLTPCVRACVRACVRVSPVLEESLSKNEQQVSEFNPLIHNIEPRSRTSNEKVHCKPTKCNDFKSDIET